MPKWIRNTLTLSLLCLAALAPALARPSLDGAKIGQLTGAQPAFNPEENVWKVSFPRTDVKVTVDGNPLPPFMGLTSWAAFTPDQNNQAMVMGDLVLFQDEVNPIMDMAFANGLAVTALHNHFFYDQPRVFFMHISGEGSVDTLAQGVRRILDQVKALRSAAPIPTSSFGRPGLPGLNSIHARALEEIFIAKAMEQDGMAKFTIGRKTKMPCGCEVSKDMGVNTWAAFSGSDDNARVDGDFVTFEGELQPVLKVLRAHKINVVAIHNHMEGDSPRTLFLHYQGSGSAAELARGVKAALDTQNSRKVKK